MKLPQEKGNEICTKISFQIIGIGSFRPRRGIGDFFCSMQLEQRLLRPLGPSPRAATAGASRTFDLSVNPVSGGHGARQTPSTTQRARRQIWGFGRNSKSPYPPPTKAEGRGLRSHLV